MDELSFLLPTQPSSPPPPPPPPPPPALNHCHHDTFFVAALETLPEAICVLEEAGS